MIRKIGLVAKREFLTTVSSKGFLIGLFVMPVLMLAIMLLAPKIMSSRTPLIRGEIVVIDHSGAALQSLKEALDPAAIAQRRDEGRRRTVEQVAPGWGGAAAQSGGPPVPQLTLIERPETTELQTQKAWLTQQSKDQRHLAVVVLHADAVARKSDAAEFGGYDLYIATGLDDATENVIHEGVRQALVSSRLRSTGVDPAAIETSMRVSRPNPTLIAIDGAQRERSGFNRALPFIMSVLLFMGVIMGGQSLMTSTIEEKSSRVVEVLLAAVSPLELMWGKLLGQLGVGLLMMAVYLGLGVLALFQFAMVGLLDPMLVVYLLVFFLITYLVFGALMLAIGAAVNQIADAQSLMGPLMLLMIVPYVLSPFIGQAPNSAFSVTMSFIPPVNTFVMLTRLASSSPPPAWQAWLTVLVGLFAVVAAVWFASKIFKIGLLMHGKPPNIATLIRWARMA
jgi:ABC-2 type transport system permease protein